MRRYLNSFFESPDQTRITRERFLFDPSLLILFIIINLFPWLTAYSADAFIVYYRLAEKYTRYTPAICQEFNGFEKCYKEPWPKICIEREITCNISATTVTETATETVIYVPLTGNNGENSLLVHTDDRKYRHSFPTQSPKQRQNQRENQTRKKRQHNI